MSTDTNDMDDRTLQIIDRLTAALVAVMLLAYSASDIRLTSFGSSIDSLVVVYAAIAMYSAISTYVGIESELNIRYRRASKTGVRRFALLVTVASLWMILFHPFFLWYADGYPIGEIVEIYLTTDELPFLTYVGAIIAAFAVIETLKIRYSTGDST